MKHSLSSQTLKQQVKLATKHWPFSDIKASEIRQILCRVYGYQDHHHFLKEKELNTNSLRLTGEEVKQQLPFWSARLAELGKMNQTQSKKLLFKLWKGYLGEQIGIPMYHCQISFFGECRDFLRGQDSFNYGFDASPNVKDCIESLGVPHTEVGRVLINEQICSLNTKLQADDKIKVYPYDDSALCSHIPGKLTFLLDVHLGTLARYLRLAGFDVLYQNQDLGDALLAELAARQDCILLTRDIGLLKHARVKYGRWLRSQEPEVQFMEVIKHYRLKHHVAPFTRCLKCNGQIDKVEKESIKSKVPESVFNYQTEFQQCQSCDQVYWPGGHVKRLKALLSMIEGA